jgi:A/G-specific adenine glycosylase
LWHKTCFKAVFLSLMDDWFNLQLVAWYRNNKRDLPWRKEKDPYKIWLSEIILQQTQVAQGLSYYLRFIEAYPNVKELASAPEDKILRLWEGLGYYSRARNLHVAAKYVYYDRKGVFPTSFAEIKNLKGVGDYTAAAIASFAYNLPHAVVDGNVYRVLSRVFGLEIPIDSARGKKEFQMLANELLDKKDPATHNQAVMEFGSQFCKPNNPDCENCVFRNKCYAFKNSKVSDLPFKAKKTKIRNRFFNYVIVADKKQDILVYKRNKADIWKGLYEFNLIESEREISEESFLKSKKFKSVCNAKFDLKLISKKYKHVLSHQHLYARFYVISLPSTFKSPQIKSNINKLRTYAFPRLIGKFLDDCDLKEIL